MVTTTVEVQLPLIPWAKLDQF